MKLQLVKYRCENCKLEFKAPQLKIGGYAEFLLRSQLTGHLAYLDAMADKTYDEVGEYLEANLKLAEKSANLIASILQKTYGIIACDPDPAGNIYQIGAAPVCPSCGSQNMEYWEVVEPSEFIEQIIPPVTHRAWSLLNDRRKAEKVDQVLTGFGY
jgi:hypothetical protein